MAITNFTNLTVENYKDLFFGTLLGAALATFIIVAILVFVVVYLYFAFAWYTIAKRKGHKKPWLAWIPFANIAMLLQLGGFHWAWIFLLLIPFVGWLVVFFFFIVANWRIFEDFHYPGWLALSPLLGIAGGGLGTLAYGIVIGFVAWKKRGVHRVSRKKRK